MRAALRDQPDQPQVDQLHGRWIQDICTFILLIYSTFIRPHSQIRTADVSLMPT